MNRARWGQPDDYEPSPIGQEALIEKHYQDKKPEVIEFDDDRREEEERDVQP